MAEWCAPEPFVGIPTNGARRSPVGGLSAERSSSSPASLFASMPPWTVSPASVSGGFGGRGYRFSPALVVHLRPRHRAPPRRTCRPELSPGGRRRPATDPTGLGLACRLVVPDRDQILLEDNLAALSTFDDATFQMIYIDPPFNTGKAQSRRTLRTVATEAGDRTGFQGRRYRTEALSSRSYDDSFDDYLAFIRPRLAHANRLLKPSGTFLSAPRLSRGPLLQGANGRSVGRECF